MKSSFTDTLLALISDWWPALTLGLIVFLGLRFIFAKVSKPVVKLDSLGLAVHEIQTSLACTEQQAKQLLAIYNGSSAKAIQEVKTGRAVLPGADVSDFAVFGGEVKGFNLTGETLIIHTQDGRSEEVSAGGEGILLLGVVDSAQRADAKGLGRADRGHTYGQLFYRKEGGWTRYLLNANRFDYIGLGDRKQNSAVRNFRVIIGDLQSHNLGPEFGTEIHAFLNDLKAPLYKQLAGFEAYAVQTLRNRKEVS